ncbi:hypothetical protein A5892_08820 [Halotalea alkalilenta]|uniref:Type II secretion system protein GspF domain-containing protein n=2 Tax=Halotalea alkalilenta TaxID=376489 RepID=A0A172YEP1_9GAMM|nr:hypothetical protein A5892_08820 [Halotalea alkalilenta]
MRSEQRLWQWQATDEDGNHRTGRLYAPTKHQAHTELAARGLIVRRLRRLRMRTKRLGPEHLALRLMQLSGLLQAGIGLLDALEQLAENAETAEEHHYWSTLRLAITEGHSLSAALGTTTLPLHAPLGTALIGLGEHSGKLATVLARLAEHLNARARLGRRLAAPLRYPAMVTVLAAGLMAVMLIKIVPTFAALYADDAAHLPLPTEVLFALSAGLSARLEACLIAVLALIASWIAARRHSARLARWLPLLGPLLQSSDKVGILEALALAQGSGLALDVALELIATPQGTLPLKRVASRVAEGEPLSVAMRAERAFGALLAALVANGERSGRLAEAFGHAADLERERLERRLERLELLLEPIVMTLLTLVIGLLVVALYLPVFDLGGEY